MKAFLKAFLVFGVFVFASRSEAVMYQARAYDPNLARWITRDPLGEDGGPNLYGFVANDPLNNIDLFGLMTGPSEIKALDKNYPDTALQIYSTAASSCWQASGHLAIKGPNSGTAITVYATGESTASGDSVVKAVNSGGTETMAVTVQRPKWLSRPGGLTPTTSSAFGIVGYDLKFRWKIEDQFHSPLAGVPVSESLTTLARYHVLGLYYVTGSAVTDSAGTVGDHYSVFFAGSSGYLYNQQNIIVGNWQASVINGLFANGGFFGNLVSVFH